MGPYLMKKIIILMTIAAAFLADPKIIFGIRSVAKAYSIDEKDWKNVSFVNLLEKIDASAMPQIYLSCGLYDPYGNFEGSQYFAELAKSKGVKVDWRPLYGGHCAVDVSSVANAMLD